MRTSTLKNPLPLVRKMSAHVQTPSFLTVDVFMDSSSPLPLNAVVFYGQSLLTLFDLNGFQKKENFELLF